MNAATVLTPRPEKALECRAKSVYLGPTPTAPRLVVGQSRASSDFAVAFGCAVAWSLFWMLLLSAAFSPPDYTTGHPSAEIGQAMLAGPGERIGWPRPIEADSCGGAMIEIDGSCVFGEDLEVRPPSGWVRR